MMNRHLEELRSRVIKCGLVFAAIFAVCFYYSNFIYTQLAKLIDTPIIATKVTSTFMVPLQLSMFCALLICLPYILYHIWSFIKPGLYQHERLNIAPWIVLSSALFYTGILFAIFVITPIALKFFTGCAPDNVTVMIDIANYLDFFVTLSMACGVAFQVPIVTVFLIKSGIVTAEQLKDKRPYVIVGAFFLGMILTPPDVISQILLALPMWGLFELGIVISKYTSHPDLNLSLK